MYSYKTGLITLTGKLAVEIFAVGNFAVGNFAVRKLCSKEIWP